MSDSHVKGEAPGGIAVRRLALRLTGVTKTFGGLVANEAIDLDVAWGEVHALLGENGAGKTTLMRIVTGLYRPDTGCIEVDGEPATFRRAEDSLAAGIGMVHQHFTLVPTLTEAENLAIRPSRFPWRNGVPAARRSADAVARHTGLVIQPNRLVRDASVSEQQRLEIVKLLSRGARILIFDEPSASLSPDEWEEVDKLIVRLREAGNAVILITHKLDEVFGLAQSYTVLRHGRVTDSGRVEDVDRARLIASMVGAQISPLTRAPAKATGDVRLHVSHLTAMDAATGAPRLSDVAFDVRSGEILGVAGIAGSGQSELVSALLGTAAPQRGRIEIDGQQPARLSPRVFYKLGGALIAEDRHAVGIASALPVWQNILVRAVRAPLARAGIVDARRARAHARALMAEYDVRADSETIAIGRLSGGNQQKAVLARELSVGPRIVVADQPVRGLDVRATSFVYEALRSHRDAGAAVLLISMDLDELLLLSDRIAVLAHGRLVGILPGTATRDQVGDLMTGGAAA